MSAKRHADRNGPTARADVTMAGLRRRFGEAVAGRAAVGALNEQRSAKVAAGE
jgi:hypothetical protein